MERYLCGVDGICDPVLTRGPIMYTNDTISDALLGLPTTAVVRTYGTTATAYEAPWN